jgi:predicted metal-dependent hydrolase
MKSCTKEYESIGSVFFERSKRARRMNISIRPFKGIRVAVPRGYSFSEAEQFLLSQRKWIITNIPKIRNVEKDYLVLPGQSLNVDIVSVAEKLQNRLDELAKQHGYTYNRVTFRKQKTLWASCSPNNNISLNIQIDTLPSHLVDYILLHELVHTKIKNHGSRFWQALDAILGDAKSLDRELRTYKLKLL